MLNCLNESARGLALQSHSGPHAYRGPSIYSCPSGIHGLLCLEEKDSCINLLLPWPRRKTLPPSQPIGQGYTYSSGNSKGLGHAGGNLHIWWTWLSLPDSLLKASTWVSWRTYSKVKLPPCFFQNPDSHMSPFTLISTLISHQLTDMFKLNTIFPTQLDILSCLSTRDLGINPII